MRILEVSFKDPESSAGGVEDFVLNLITKFSESGHKVTCLFSEDPILRENQINFRKVNLLKIKTPRTPFLSFWYKIVYNFAVLAYTLWHRKDYDVIHTNGNNGVFLPIFFGKRTVSTFFGLPIIRVWNTIDGKFSIKNFGNLFLAFISTLLHLPSLVFSRYVVAENPMIFNILKIFRSESEVKLIYNTVDVDSFKPPSHLEKENLKKELELDPNRLIAIWIGNDSNGYGQEIAISIARQYEDSLILILVGAKSKNGAPNILQTGRVPHELLTKYIKASDFMLFPQKYPGISLSMVSCLAAGLKVVTFSKHLKDFFTSSNVFFTENIDEMGKIVVDILKDPSLLNTNGQDPLMNNFYPRYCADRYLELFDKILSN